MKRTRTREKWIIKCASISCDQTGPTGLSGHTDQTNIKVVE